MSSTDELPVQVGDLLLGKYRVRRVLGAGGMGVVVEATHLALDERVALKFLLPAFAESEEAVARFAREARAAAKIKSEHVARVSDVGTLDSGSPYMVMEFLEGSDLGQVVRAQGVLPLGDAVDYVIQACEAIAEAHSRSIIHRDLKPANLFLSKRSNGTPIVKVLDFGISKTVTGDLDDLTKTTAAMGSAFFMSPEQMRQARTVDHRTDIYALGVSLYHLLAGRYPFAGDTLPQLCAEVLTGIPLPLGTLRSDLPDGFAAVLEKAYARDRSDRYSSVVDLVNALAPFAPERSRTVIEGISGMDHGPLVTTDSATTEGVATAAPPVAAVSESAMNQASTMVLPAGGFSPDPSVAPSTVQLPVSTGSVPNIAITQSVAHAQTGSAEASPKASKSAVGVTALALSGAVVAVAIAAFVAFGKQTESLPAPAASAEVSSAVEPAASTIQIVPPSVSPSVPALSASASSAPAPSASAIPEPVVVAPKPTEAPPRPQTAPVSSPPANKKTPKNPFED